MTPTTASTRSTKKTAPSRKPARKPSPSRSTSARKPISSKVPTAAPKRGRRVFISGISGYFAQGLLPLLLKDPNVETIVGIDKQPLPKAAFHKKINFYALDSRDESVGELMKGCDVVFHFAFVLLRRFGQPDVDKINIAGSKNIFNAAIASGIRKIIFTSSAVAYGMYPGNPALLTEESALRPNEDVYYSRAKGEVERYLDQVEKEQPDMCITRLRPSTVVGPNAEEGRVASLIAPTGTLIRGFDPQIQLTHEDDLTAALMLAYSKNIPGTFNVASDEPKTLSELFAMRHVKVRILPAAVGGGLMRLSWMFGKSLFAPEWIKLSMYPIVVSNKKLKLAGWKPKYTTSDTFRAVLRAHNLDS